MRRTIAVLLAGWLLAFFALAHLGGGSRAWSVEQVVLISPTVTIRQTAEPERHTYSTYYDSKGGLALPSSVVFLLIALVEGAGAVMGLRLRSEREGRRRWARWAFWAGGSSALAALVSVSSFSPSGQSPFFDLRALVPLLVWGAAAAWAAGSALVVAVWGVATPRR